MFFNHNRGLGSLGGIPFNSCRNSEEFLFGNPRDPEAFHFCMAIPKPLSSLASLGSPKEPYKES